jgi:spore coat polysaccharide biosynthesis protein SpsF
MNIRREHGAIIVATGAHQWAGRFGDDYVDRNNDLLLGSRINLFTKVLSKLRKLDSVFEVGTNIGGNLDPIKLLRPVISTNGIEINSKATAEAVRKGHNLVNHSALDFAPTQTFDLTFTSGLSIYINPDHLNNVYDLLFSLSHKYIMVVEYFNRTPIKIEYRGHFERLFKRNFASDLLDIFSLHVLDYGFIWRRDPVFPLDDISWFLMKKQ